MASWDIVEGRNANYIVVYSLLHNETTTDIQRWLQESDAVILEQGTYLDPNSKRLTKYIKKYKVSTIKLFRELEKGDSKPVFTTDVTPDKIKHYLDTILRIGAGTTLSLDAITQLEETFRKKLTRRQFLGKGLRITTDMLVLLHLAPILQGLALDIPGQRGIIQEGIRRNLEFTQEFVRPFVSADVRDAINALKFEAIARELIQETGKRPTILVYDFRPNHAMLQSFLRRPEMALIYLRQRSLDKHVRTEEIPRAIRLDFNGRDWKLTRKTLELPKLERIPKAIRRIRPPEVKVRNRQLVTKLIKRK